MGGSINTQCANRFTEIIFEAGENFLLAKISVRMVL